MPIEQVADIAGHSSVMAKKVYLKLDMKKEAKAKAKRNNEFYKKNKVAKSQEPQQEQVILVTSDSTIASFVEHIERNAVQRKELYDTINKQKEELQQQKQEANAMRKQLKMANKVLNEYEEVISVEEYRDKFADMVLEKEED